MASETRSIEEEALLGVLAEMGVNDVLPPIDTVIDGIKVTVEIVKGASGFDIGVSSSLTEYVSYLVTTPEGVLEKINTLLTDSVFLGRRLHTKKEAAVVKTMRLVFHKIQEIKEEDVQCVVCFEDAFENRTDCNHTTCVQCVQKLIKRRYSYTCPTCRQETELSEE